MKNNKLLYICVFALSIIFSFTVFVLLYNYNNKYTHLSNQPINGLVYLDDFDIASDKYNYLINDWEYYEDLLLTPEDFQNIGKNADLKYISIGEQTSVKREEAFGNCTYSVVLSLPEKEQTYSLLLPEIYSSYILYINENMLIDSSQTQRIMPRTVSFEAKGITRIIISTSANMGVYSGMVYPPAFGTYYAIEKLKNIQLFMNSVLFVVILLLLLLSVSTAFTIKRESIVIFALLCLFSFGAVCYPIIHTFYGINKPIFQDFELLCTYVIYTIVIYLQSKVCNTYKIISILMLGINIVMCIFAFLYGCFSPIHSVDLRLYFSYAVNIFKWLTIVYLFDQTLVAILKGKFNSVPILFGSSFFMISILADRLFPIYEPIYLGWFTEIGVAVMILSLAYIHFANIIKNLKMNIALKSETNQMIKRMEFQNESYIHLLNQVENTARLQHDMKQHIRVMESLIKEKNYTELENYISSYKSSFKDLKMEVYCDNLVINALLHYYSLCAKKILAEFNVKILVSGNIFVEDTDISIIMGNLLENAIEACSKQTKGKRKINVNCRIDKHEFIFFVENSYSGTISKNDNMFLSEKTGEIGIGIESVKSTLNKYKGVLNIEYDETVFKAYAGILY